MLAYAHSHPSPPPPPSGSTATTTNAPSSLHLPLPKSASRRGLTLSAPILAALATSRSWAVSAGLSQDSSSETDTLANIPGTLSGECKSPKGCKKPRIQRPKSRKAESCTVKCVNTCIRGGDGAPGEGPLNIIRPLVVFKRGFRSRKYCLVECSDICNLIRDDDDYGP